MIALRPGSPDAVRMDTSGFSSHNLAPMKFLFDIFPVLLFFVAYKFADIYVATAVAIAASFGQIGWLWFRGKKIEPMLWVSLAIIVVLGGATLILHNATFIKWKPTVLYWAFAVALLVGQFAFGKNLIRAVMEKNITLPDSVWSKLSFSWVGFFVLMGVLNLYVAYHYTEAQWVNFKLFGGMGLMVLFVIGQGLFLSKHISEKEGQ
jgi:intracellular septation protein